MSVTSFCLTIHAKLNISLQRMLYCTDSSPTVSSETLTCIASLLLRFDGPYLKVNIRVQTSSREVVSVL
jgi:hypothetical protein